MALTVCGRVVLMKYGEGTRSTLAGSGSCMILTPRTERFRRIRSSTTPDGTMQQEAEDFARGRLRSGARLNVAHQCMGAASHLEPKETPQTSSLACRFGSTSRNDATRFNAHSRRRTIRPVPTAAPGPSRRRRAVSCRPALGANFLWPAYYS
jgi:hypothetical protein